MGQDENPLKYAKYKLRMSLFDAGLRLGYAYRQHHRGNTINYQAWKWRVKLIFTTVDRRSLSDRRGRELGTVWKFKIFLLHKFLHEINFGKWTFRKLQHVEKKFSISSKNVRASKIVKVASLKTLDLSKLISRKIWVSENFLDFYTVVGRHMQETCSIMISLW